jgi:6-pyruvoyltetrahydropterin/6-carboxytetrahydropterin synthase
VALEGPLQLDGPATGMIEDFDVVGQVVRATVLAELDHRSLNDVLENPTAERILVWIWNRLEPELPALAGLVLWETSTACAVITKGDPVTGAAAR